MIEVKNLDVSIVVPVFNEEESIPELYRWITRVMRDTPMLYEIIFNASPPKPLIPARLESF